MKNIYSILILLLGVVGMVSCESDRDSNPTLNDPTEFVLNTPRYVSGVYDLQNTQSILLTCSQPNYGFTAATIYRVEVSVKSDFSEFATLPTTYNTAAMEVNALEMAVALVGLLGVEEEADYPTEMFPVYIRLRANLSNGSGEIHSNMIELPQVKGYFALDPMVMPENMYIIGNVVGNWDWTQSREMVPVHSAPGKFWAVVYLGQTDGGDNAEIKFNWEKAWTAGEPVGIGNSTIDDNSKALAGISGSDNIVIENPGWYLVVMTVEIEGRSYKYSIQFLEPNVYVFGATVGNAWEAKVENRFTVPTTGTGDFVSPPLSNAGELRMCVKLDGAEWWHTEFIILDGKIAYRGTGDDQERVTAAAGKVVHLNFTDGTGSIQ